MTDTTNSSNQFAANKRLFWGCFIALIATAFGFIIRALIIGDWAAEFNLTETQKGELLGVGLWPFAISILLFSLIIDRIGYRNAMIFGLVCHVLSFFITIFASGYWMLYIGTFIVALGNGTVEAYINPVVATLFSKEKTKWLNTLHAGWPGGLVLGGILTLTLGSSIDWRVKVGLILIPTIAYAVMLWREKFPINERVAAGVPYKEMLKEVGTIGALIISYLIMSEIGRVFGFSNLIIGVFVIAITAGFGWYTRSLGRPLFILFLLIMMPLATTELGVDSWITELMTPEFKNMGVSAGWILVYTSAIMMVLRFSAGPIIHRLKPLGLLAASAVLAGLGLVFLSQATGLTILLAATLYGIGKSFFWPTTLGVVAEQFPRGGALTLNAVAGVGMLAVGIVGAAFLGYLQDESLDKNLAKYDQANQSALHSTYMTEKKSVFGTYEGLDGEKISAASEGEKEVVSELQAKAKKNTLLTVAILPLIMLVCYLALIAWFRSKGGYRAVELSPAEGNERN